MSGDRYHKREKIKELVSILMESGYYFDLTPKDRLRLILALIKDMAS